MTLSELQPASPRVIVAPDSDAEAALTALGFCALIELIDCADAERH